MGTGLITGGLILVGVLILVGTFGGLEILGGVEILVGGETGGLTLVEGLVGFVGAVEGFEMILVGLVGVGTFAEVGVIVLVTGSVEPPFSPFFNPVTTLPAAITGAETNAPTSPVLLLNPLMLICYHTDLIC